MSTYFAQSTNGGHSPERIGIRSWDVLEFAKLEIIINIEQRGKPEYPEKKPGEKTLGARTRTDNKLNPHMSPSPGIELGPYLWQGNAPTTASSLLPVQACHD